MKFFFLFIVIVLLYSCKNEDKKQRPIVLNENDSLMMKYREVMAVNSEFDAIFKKASQSVLRAYNEHIISNIKRVQVTKQNIIVADSHGKQLLVFTKDGKLINTIGKAGSGPGEYNSLYDIDVNSKGEILVFDVSSLRVSKFKIDGTFTTSYKVKFGVGICSDLKGGFYQYNSTESAIAEKNSIKYYNANGIYEKSFCTPFFKIGMVGANIDIDSKGNVYVIHSSQYLVKKFSPEGDFIKDFGNIPKFYKSLEVPKDRFANQEELDAFTPLTKILITKGKLVLVELVRSKPRARWIDIYDTDGNLLKSGIKIAPALSLGAIGDDDIIYFIKNPPDDVPSNFTEVPDYQLIGYKIRAD
ncbi:MAG: hypothetical protein COT22_05235 [Ignavibacteria bacterium CG08_land_8_20_14_0_20_37_9]|nr:MAG: hypothetical protein COT22_05235 [Ignavibacteria bacterium CG08_land_8_20_14_0_20_37_9]